MGDWDFLHGLTGRDLEFAMSTGATYEEWQEIHERELREAIEDGDEDAVNEIMSMKMFHDYMYHHLCKDESERLEERRIREEEKRRQDEIAAKRLQRKREEHRAKKQR